MSKFKQIRNRMKAEQDIDADIMGPCSASITNKIHEPISEMERIIC